MIELPHSFRDAALLELALTHSSTGAGQDNERLEYLGDAALDLVVAEDLFRRHASLAEGELTALKALIVSRRTLAEAARRLGLATVARLGGGLSRRALSRAVLANLYEAVLGAVYLDGGLEAARAFVARTLAAELLCEPHPASGRSAKQILQEYSQLRHGSPPLYRVLRERGRAHARAFLVRAEIADASYPSAWGRTRKEAEQWAAYEALLRLEGEDAQ